MTPEGQVKALVKKRLKLEFPSAFVRWPVQNGMGQPMLDCHFTHRGLAFVIETKAPGKKLTDRQKTTVAEIQDARGPVYVVDDEVSLAAALDDIHRIAEKFGL